MEAILGRDGVGLADCAVAESKFEKGENITGRMLTILPRISEIHQINATNYGLFQLPIEVKVRDKITPVKSNDFKISATSIVYRQTLENSTLTIEGTMKDPATGEAVNGTFTWKDGTIKPNAGSCPAEWAFTPDEPYGGIYADVTGKVNPTPSRSPS